MRHSRHAAATTILLAVCVPLPAQQPTFKAARPTAVFVENRGQFDPAVKYRLTNRASAVWLTATGIVFDGVRQSSPGRIVFSETFAGPNANVALEAGQPSPGAYGFVTDAHALRWPVRAFSRVEYKDVWPGISVRLTGTGMGIEQEFMLEARADAANIAVTCDGVDSMKLDEEGSLAIVTPLGTVREDLPQAYREVSGHRVAVPGRYKLTGPRTYGFQFDTYAGEYPLVIGPIQFDLSQSSGSATGTPVINFFDVAPTSTLPGQAAIATFSLTGATAATIDGVAADCSNGGCGGSILFNPASTTDYVLEASGAGGNVRASQKVEVGQYLPNPPPVPAGLQVTWQGACWLKHYPKAYCNGACQGMAFSVTIPSPPSQLPLEATLYSGTTTCNPAYQDNLNDAGTLTGSGGWIFWFIHHPNKHETSAIWTIGNQSSGCVSYADAPDCQ